MVPTASKATPIHHTTKVHWTICATDELEIKFCKQIARSWNTTTTSGRGPEQTTRSGCSGGASTVCSSLCSAISSSRCSYGTVSTSSASCSSSSTSYLRYQQHVH